MIDISKLLINDRPVPASQYDEVSEYYVSFSRFDHNKIMQRQQTEHDLFYSLCKLLPEEEIYRLRLEERKYNSYIDNNPVHKDFHIELWSSNMLSCEPVGKYGRIIQEYLKRKEAWDKC